MNGHLQWSNYPNFALRTALSPGHPIRQLLHVHFWRSAYVAYKSLVSLIPEKGLLHRGTSFDITGLHQLYRDALHNFKFQTFPDEMQDRGLTDYGHLYPAAFDGLKYHGIVAQYVSDFVDLYYKDDESVLADEELVNFFIILREKLGDTIPTPGFQHLKTVLTELIFRVTAWHTHVGNAIPLIDDPGCVALRLRKGHLLASVDSLYIQGLITSMTTMTMPKMNEDWSQMFFDVQGKNVYYKFKEELTKLTTWVEEQNTKRLYPFNDFNPQKFCLSVSS